MKRFWKNLKIFLVGLFGGMKITEDETLHQSGLDSDGSIGINQQITDRTVAKALLKGELTQEVIDLRYRTYLVARESKHYNYFSPTLAKKKKLNDYKYATNSISLDDNREIVTIQNNNSSIENIEEALLRINDDGKYSEYTPNYTIIINRNKKITHRFLLEKFITKIVVKKGDNEYSSVLDLYVSKYPNLNVPTSKPFIKELERIIDNGIRSDIFEINTIEFETSNAYKIDDMYHFEFGDIQLERIFEFNGCYIIRLITNIIDGGTDKTEEFYSERMAKRYENKESKNLTYHVDVNAQIRTYVCADCGKTVTYDARALDAMNASDDFSDGKITEYLDFEMTEHEFGRMLCKDCAMKEQEKIYNNVINNINK